MFYYVLLFQCGSPHQLCTGWLAGLRRSDGYQVNIYNSESLCSLGRGMNYGGGMKLQCVSFPCYTHRSDKMGVTFLYPLHMHNSTGTKSESLRFMVKFPIVLEISN